MDRPHEWTQAEIAASWRRWDKQHWAQRHDPVEPKRPAWDAEIRASWERWDAIHLAHLKEPSKRELIAAWKQRPAVLVSAEQGARRLFRPLTWREIHEAPETEARADKRARKAITDGVAQGWLVTAQDAALEVAA